MLITIVRNKTRKNPDGSQIALSNAEQIKEYLEAIKKQEGNDKRYCTLYIGGTDSKANVAKKYIPEEELIKALEAILDLVGPTERDVQAAVVQLKKNEKEEFIKKLENESLELKRQQAIHAEEAKRFGKINPKRVLTYAALADEVKQMQNKGDSLTKLIEVINTQAEKERQLNIQLQHTVIKKDAANKPVQKKDAEGKPVFKINEQGQKVADFERISLAPKLRKLFHKLDGLVQLRQLTAEEDQARREYNQLPGRYEQDNPFRALAPAGLIAYKDSLASIQRDFDERFQVAQAQLRGILAPETGWDKVKNFFRNYLIKPLHEAVRFVVNAFGGNMQPYAPPLTEQQEILKKDMLSLEQQKQQLVEAFYDRVNNRELELSDETPAEESEYKQSTAYIKEHGNFARLMLDDKSPERARVAFIVEQQLVIARGTYRQLLDELKDNKSNFAFDFANADHVKFINAYNRVFRCAPTVENAARLESGQAVIRLNKAFCDAVLQHQREIADVYPNLEHIFLSDGTDASAETYQVATPDGVLDIPKTYAETLAAIATQIARSDTDADTVQVTGDLLPLNYFLRQYNDSVDKFRAATADVENGKPLPKLRSYVTMLNERLANAKRVLVERVNTVALNSDNAESELRDLSLLLNAAKQGDNAEIEFADLGAMNLLLELIKGSFDDERRAMASAEGNIFSAEEIQALGRFLKPTESAEKQEQAAKDAMVKYIKYHRQQAEKFFGVDDEASRPSVEMVTRALFTSNLPAAEQTSAIREYEGLIAKYCKVRPAEAEKFEQNFNLYEKAAEQLGIIANSVQRDLTNKTTIIAQFAINRTMLNDPRQTKRELPVTKRVCLKIRLTESRVGEENTLVKDCLSRYVGLLNVQPDADEIPPYTGADIEYIDFILHLATPTQQREYLTKRLRHLLMVQDPAIPLAFSVEELKLMALYGRELFPIILIDYLNDHFHLHGEQGMQRLLDIHRVTKNLVPDALPAIAPLIVNNALRCMMSKPAEGPAARDVTVQAFMQEVLDNKVSSQLFAMGSADAVDNTHAFIRRNAETLLRAELGKPVEHSRTREAVCLLLMTEPALKRVYSDHLRQTQEVQDTLPDGSPTTLKQTPLQVLGTLEYTFGTHDSAVAAAAASASTTIASEVIEDVVVKCTPYTYLRNAALAAYPEISERLHNLRLSLRADAAVQERLKELVSQKSTMTPDYPIEPVLEKLIAYFGDMATMEMLIKADVTAFSDLLQQADKFLHDKNLSEAKVILADINEHLKKAKIARAQYDSLTALNSEAVRTTTSIQDVLEALLNKDIHESAQGQLYSLLVVYASAELMDRFLAIWFSRIAGRYYNAAKPSQEAAVAQRQLNGFINFIANPHEPTGGFERIYKNELLQNTIASYIKANKADAPDTRAAKSNPFFADAFSQQMVDKLATDTHPFLSAWLSQLIPAKGRPGDEIDLDKAIVYAKIDRSEELEGQKIEKIKADDEGATSSQGLIEQYIRNTDVKVLDGSFARKLIITFANDANYRLWCQKRYDAALDEQVAAIKRRLSGILSGVGAAVAGLEAWGTEALNRLRWAMQDDGSEHKAIVVAVENPEDKAFADFIKALSSLLEALASSKADVKKGMELVKQHLDKASVQKWQRFAKRREVQALLRAGYETLQDVLPLEVVLDHYGTDVLLQHHHTKMRAFLANAEQPTVAPVKLMLREGNSLVVKEFNGEQAIKAYALYRNSESLAQVRRNGRLDVVNIAALRNIEVNGISAQSQLAGHWQLASIDDDYSWLLPAVWTWGYTFANQANFALMHQSVLRALLSKRDLRAVAAYIKFATEAKNNAECEAAFGIDSATIKAIFATYINEDFAAAGIAEAWNVALQPLVLAFAPSMAEELFNQRLRWMLQTQALRSEPFGNSHENENTFAPVAKHLMQDALIVRAHLEQKNTTLAVSASEVWKNFQQSQHEVRPLELVLGLLSGTKESSMVSYRYAIQQMLANPVAGSAWDLFHYQINAPVPATKDVLGQTTLMPMVSAEALQQDEELRGIFAGYVKAQFAQAHLSRIVVDTNENARFAEVRNLTFHFANKANQLAVASLEIAASLSREELPVAISLELESSLITKPVNGAHYFEFKWADFHTCETLQTFYASYNIVARIKEGSLSQVEAVYLQSANTANLQRLVTARVEHDVLPLLSNERVATFCADLASAKWTARIDAVNDLRPYRPLQQVLRTYLTAKGWTEALETLFVTLADDANLEALMVAKIKAYLDTRYQETNLALDADNLNILFAFVNQHAPRISFERLQANTTLQTILRDFEVRASVSNIAYPEYEALYVAFANNKMLDEYRIDHQFVRLLQQDNAQNTRCYFDSLNRPTRVGVGAASVPARPKHHVFCTTNSTRMPERARDLLEKEEANYITGWNQNYELVIARSIGTYSATPLPLLCRSRIRTLHYLIEMSGEDLFNGVALIRENITRWKQEQARPFVTAEFQQEVDAVLAAMLKAEDTSVTKNKDYFYVQSLLVFELGSKALQQQFNFDRIIALLNDANLFKHYSNEDTTFAYQQGESIEAERYNALQRQSVRNNRSCDIEKLQALIGENNVESLFESINQKYRSGDLDANTDYAKWVLHFLPENHALYKPICGIIGLEFREQAEQLAYKSAFDALNALDSVALSNLQKEYSENIALQKSLKSLSHNSSQQKAQAELDVAKAAQKAVTMQEKAMLDVLSDNIAEDKGQVGEIGAEISTRTNAILALAKDSPNPGFFVLVQKLADNSSDINGTAKRLADELARVSAVDTKETQLFLTSMDLLFALALDKPRLEAIQLQLKTVLKQTQAKINSMGSFFVATNELLGSGKDLVVNKAREVHRQAKEVNSTISAIAGPSQTPAILNLVSVFTAQRSDSFVKNTENLVDTIVNCKQQLQAWNNLRNNAATTAAEWEDYYQALSQFLITNMSSMELLRRKWTEIVSKPTYTNTEVKRLLQNLVQQFNLLANISITATVEQRLDVKQHQYSYEEKATLLQAQKDDCKNNLEYLLGLIASVTGMAEKPDLASFNHEKAEALKDLNSMLFMDRQGLFRNLEESKAQLHAELTELPKASSKTALVNPLPLHSPASTSSLSRSIPLTRSMSIGTAVQPVAPAAASCRERQIRKRIAVLEAISACVKGKSEQDYPMQKVQDAVHDCRRALIMDDLLAKELKQAQQWLARIDAAGSELLNSSIQEFVDATCKTLSNDIQANMHKAILGLFERVIQDTRDWIELQSNKSTTDSVWEGYYNAQAGWPLDWRHIKFEKTGFNANYLEKLQLLYNVLPEKSFSLLETLLEGLNRHTAMVYSIKAPLGDKETIIKKLDPKAACQRAAEKDAFFRCSSSSSQSVPDVSSRKGYSSSPEVSSASDGSGPPSVSSSPEGMTH